MSLKTLTYNRILIVRLRFHGDMLLTTPLISTLKARYPEAAIDVLLYEDTIPILSKHPDIHRLYGLKRKTAGAMEKVSDFLAMRNTLKRNRYDLIVNLADQWPIALLIKSLNCPYSLSIQRGGARQSLWRACFTRCLEPTGQHIVEQNFSLLAPLDVPEEDRTRPLSLYYGPEDTDRVFALVPELAATPYVVIQPTARQYFKCWDNDKFAQVIDHLKQQGLEVVLTCGPGADDLAVVNEISTLCEHKPNLSLAGKTHFLELAALIDNAVLYIGVDSAPMHMAAAPATPTVCLFGPTDHGKWRPWSDNHIVLWAGDYTAMPERESISIGIKIPVMYPCSRRNSRRSKVAGRPYGCFAKYRRKIRNSA
ncbi:MULTISPECIES: lipopolysaccharide core heptosyltransferase RfaQ [Symbiopectobacterium]|uniref:lipopolysaccharide core heptosyltransferase RfaQ n=1 Tax=Symbiopectobacterium TaxID=801 RepID=UPI0027E08B53|nr:lipopolysaccharide core heptosyltransferase RfaQ [Candidatus Symbiopectobacterium endolongispinus]